ncbi:serendipity locus protein delta-like [Episyrphus balteatus]|uniref:serendipity locus protein delta-like n=1 Tax=Episyrphus balteatus TaxID=286459 RepID=UPI002484E619|nr:serendipity locus protein delta-like [Episyrphus balteatus]
MLKCILCSHQINSNLGYYNIGDTIIQYSKKTIKSILMHLSKCIQTDHCFEDSSCICNPCYDKVVEYDQIMIRLLNCQKELSKMLENSLKVLDETQDNQNDYEELEEDQNIKEENQNIKTEESDSNNSFNNDTNDNQNDSDPESSISERLTHSFDCTICDKSLKSKTSLKNHLESHATAVKCKICGALRKDEEYLELHMNVHEGKTENDCRYCPKRYSRRANVIRHMHLHWDKKKFQCEKCGLRFSQANILYNHKLVHDAEEQPLICNVCQQSFKSKKTFRHHMITHREDRPMHTCEVCGKRFTERYTLKMHLKTHMNCDDGVEVEPPKKVVAPPKQFPCIICSKVLGTLESLESHRAKVHDVISSDSFFHNNFC